MNSKPYKIQKGNVKMKAYLQCLHKEFEIRDREADMVASGKMARRGLKKFEAWTRE
jgi:hypothetical protein